MPAPPHPNPSPIARLFAAVRETVQAAGDVKNAAVRLTCLGCPTPLTRARPGEVQQRLCDVCAEKAAQGTANLLAGAAEFVLKKPLADFFKGKP
jgi:hypothetical protein